MDKYIGFDIDSNKTVACVVEKGRKETFATIRTAIPAMQQYLQQQRRGGYKVHLTFEISGQAGFIYDSLLDCVASITVSNPTKMTWIYRTTKKNDRIDARKQAIRVSGFGGPEVMRLEDVGPLQAGPGWELVLREGADYTLDHGEAGYMEKVMELTEGRGVDVVLEMLANVNFGRDLEVMAVGGRVVVIGCRGTVEINPRLMMKRDVSIVGMITTNAAADEMAEIHRGIGSGLEDGSLRPVVGLELPLAEAARSHREVMESGHLGKIVLNCK